MRLFFDEYVDGQLDCWEYGQVPRGFNLRVSECAELLRWYGFVLVVGTDELAPGTWMVRRERLAGLLGERKGRSVWACLQPHGRMRDGEQAATSVSMYVADYADERPW